MPKKLSTDHIIEKERPSYWNHLVSSVLGRLDTTPQKERGFRGTILYNQISSSVVAQVASTQLEVKRPESYISNPHEEFLKINFQIRGEATLEQNKETVLLQPGSWVIYDNTRPYTLSFHNDYTQLLFLVPHSQLLNKLPHIDLLRLQAFSSQTGMGKLLFNHIQTSLQESAGLSAVAQQTVSQMMIDLLLLALTERSAQTAALPASTRLLEVQQFIQSQLHNPDLSLDLIATRLHLSKRYIHKLFAANELSVNNYIWQERIGRCQIDLQQPHLAHCSLNQIAYSWGFQSASHFSRLFKKVVGVSPSRYRQRPYNKHDQ